MTRNRHDCDTRGTEFISDLCGLAAATNERRRKSPTFLNGLRPFTSASTHNVTLLRASPPYIAEPPVVACTPAECCVSTGRVSSGLCTRARFHLPALPRRHLYITVLRSCTTLTLFQLSQEKQVTRNFRPLRGLDLHYANSKIHYSDFALV